MSDLGSVKSSSNSESPEAFDVSLQDDFFTSFDVRELK